MGDLRTRSCSCGSRLDRTWIERVGNGATGVLGGSEWPIHLGHVIRFNADIALRYNHAPCGGPHSLL